MTRQCFHRRLRTVAILFASVLLFAAGALRAQPITIQLFQPPPNQLKIADLWRIRLVNPTQNTYTVCLFGTVDEINIGKRLLDATTARFTLPPGTKMVTGSEIQPIDANYYDDKYKNFFLRTGQAPSGAYRICVEVRVDCGPVAVATDCKDAQVQPTTPPILVSPADESTVGDRFPTFSWLPPSPLRAGQQVRYSLRIVEVLGRQTPYDAMASNPPWFERASIPAGVFSYPLSARQFRSTQRYAWQVKASMEGIPLGESEIWWFQYSPGVNDDPTGRSGGRDSSNVRLSGGGKPNVQTIQNPTRFSQIGHGVVLFNPEGDVKKVFAEPPVYGKDVPLTYEATKLTAKQLVDVFKELVRSCNE